MADTDIRWEGPDGLRGLLVPIDELIPHPENPRRGNLDVIEESLTMFGQQKPVVVQESSGFIVAGNHLYRGGTERKGWSHMAAVISPMDDETAMRYLLMDNRSSDIGTYDYDEMVKILKDLHDRGGLAGTGYSPDDYDDMVAQMNQVAESARQDFEGDFAETEEQRKAREEARAQAPVMREVVLLLRPEAHTSLGRMVRALRKEYGTETVTETVVEAVRREAGRLAADPAPEQPVEEPAAS